MFSYGVVFYVAFWTFLINNLGIGLHPSTYTVGISVVSWHFLMFDVAEGLKNMLVCHIWPS